MGSKTLSRIVITGPTTATSAERWDVGRRIRDVEVGPDGTLWVLEDPNRRAPTRSQQPCCT